MGIAVLGPLTVDGGSVRLGPRDRVVLEALVVHPGEVVGPERLADALWGERPPGSWSKVVQGCVMRLRKALGADAIETVEHGYRLTLAGDDLDIVCFDRLHRRARELLALGEPERAAYVLDEALDLWRGPALKDLEDWDDGRAEASRLDELRQDLEELRVDAAIQAGRCREVLDRAQSLVTQAPLRERRWSLLALAQYQAGRQADSLRTIRQVRGVLSAELGLDPGVEIVELERAILQQDPRLDPGEPPSEASSDCPYQGLLPFGPEDAERFFGRETAVAECLRRLRTTGVLVVVGPSGSGKSSLVRAGVVAALLRDHEPVVLVTPGAHPMDALPRRTSGTPPTLVVDQCEEAFTVCRDEGERASFLRALATYAERAPLVVVLRADRTGDVSAHPQFSRVFEHAIYLLSAFTPEDLRACMERPAQQAGLLLEPGLVDLLMREVLGEPGALPLLSHALRETWTHREGRSLTVAGYRATGGIRGAVARSAEEVYARVPVADQPLFRDLLLRLVAPPGDGGPARNRMPLRLVADDERHQAIVEQLVAARLVTSDAGVLELAHESIAEAWPRLADWLDEDTEGHRIWRHLTATADAWDAMGRPDGELYRGARLARAREWCARVAPELTGPEREFLTASGNRAQAELDEARERVAREGRARRRTQWFAGALALALVIAVVTAALATHFQHSAQARARDAAQASLYADANRIAALSASVGPLDQSLLLAAEAARMADTPATRAGLLSALVQHRRATQVTHLGNPAADAELADHGRTLFFSTSYGVFAWPTGSTAPVRRVAGWNQPEDIAASPAGDLVALSAWKDDDTVQVGVFTSDGTRRLLLAGDDEIGGWPASFGFSPDGTRLRMLVLPHAEDGSGWQGFVREIDISTGRPVRTIPVQRSHDDGVFVWGAFADDGLTAVSWTQERRVHAQTIDLADGSRRNVHVVRRSSETLGFVPLSTGLAQRWADGAVALYGHDGRVAQVLDLHRGQVEDVVVSPDRRWAATVDSRGGVTTWDVDRRTGRWTERASLDGHTGAVTAVAVDPRGRTLVTASRDGTAITWDMSEQGGFGSGVPGLGDRWIANTPQVIVPGRLVVAPTRPAAATFDAFADGVDVSAVFLDPSTGRVVDRVAVGKTVAGASAGSSVALSPDRTKVAVTYGHGTVVLDTRTRAVVARVVLDDIDEFGSQGPELVWCSVWTPDGSRLLIGADGRQLNATDGGLVVVDTATWRVEPERIDLHGAPQTLEVSPDGRWLAAGMTIPQVNDPPPGSVHLLDARTLRPVRTLDLGPGSFPLDVSFSPDGTLLAAGGDPGTISVFDVGTGRPLHEPTQVHTDLIQQLEWLPDGSALVSSARDGKVALYDPRQGLVRASLPGAGDGAAGYTFLIAVTAQEITALTGAQDGRVYSLDARRWLDYACVVAGRDLTRDEWSTYLPHRPYRRTCGGGP